MDIKTDISNFIDESVRINLVSQAKKKPCRALKKYRGFSENLSLDKKSSSLALSQIANAHIPSKYLTQAVPYWI